MFLSNLMANRYDYNWLGYGLTLHFPDGGELFLQGDEASELFDILEACHTQADIDMILSEYELAIED